MSFDPGHCQQMREALRDFEGIEERRMFGGLAFLRDGHMICGVHGKGVMFRVGPAQYPVALELPDVGEMTFTGRPMKGLVAAGDAAMADDALFARLMDMALGFVASLPPKA